MSAVPVEESPVGPFVDRAFAVLLLVTAIAVTIVLRSVPPDPRGHGTHEFLGMDPCSWPIEYGIPCPTCGATTAATHLVHLSPWRAFATHPFGAVVAGVGLWSGALGLVSLARRTSLVAHVLRLPYGSMFAGAIVLLFASWAYRWLTWDA